MTRHPLDGNAIAADAHYDRPDPRDIAWGDNCPVWLEPDEDCPKPWKCTGTIERSDGVLICDTCCEVFS